MKTKQLTGVYEILKERIRQTTRLGWTPEHDDTHTEKELTRAALTFIGSAMPEMAGLVSTWPWDNESYARAFVSKDMTPREKLIRAGALIAAEIDRLDRRDGK